MPAYVIPHAAKHHSGNKLPAVVKAATSSRLPRDRDNPAEASTGHAGLNWLQTARNDRSSWQQRQQHQHPAALKSGQQTSNEKFDWLSRSQAQCATASGDWTAQNLGGTDGRASAMPASRQGQVTSCPK